MLPILILLCKIWYFPYGYVLLIVDSENLVPVHIRYLPDIVNYRVKWKWYSINFLFIKLIWNVEIVTTLLQ